MNANQGTHDRHHARGQRCALSIAGAVLALLGGLFLAAGPLGCGTEDFHASDGARLRAETPPPSPPPAPAPSDLNASEATVAALPAGRADLNPPSPPAAAGASRPAAPRVESPDANSPAPTYREAEALYRQGNYDEAVCGFAAHVRTTPRSAWGHYMLGLAHWKRGEHVAAAEALSEAAAIRPDMTRAHVNLARVCLDARRPSEAHRAAVRATVLAPDDAEAQRVLARSLHNLGLADQALSVYKRVLTLRPDDVWAMNNMGLILIEEERFLEAVQPLSQATRLAGDVAVFHNNLGVALERLGHPAAAVSAYRQALASDSTYTRAAVSLERILPRAAIVDAPPIDLEAMAQQFAGQIHAWQAQEDQAAAERTF